MDASSGITRRGFVAGSAAAAASLYLPVTAAAKGRRRRLSADVVVIGAGLAGLSAARDIAASGRHVVVLEARDRVGGRTRNHPVSPGVISELGGEFVGPTQDRVLALAQTLGVGTFKTYNDGDNLLYVGGRLSRYPAFPGLSPDPDFAAALQLAPKLDAMAAAVGVRAPWKARHAEQWDRMSLGHWVARETKRPGARQLIGVLMRALFGAEPDEISLLFTLFYIAAAGNEQSPGSLLRLLGTGGGAQDSRFVGGSQLLSIGLAQRLGGRVHLRQPVRRITHQRGRVHVEADGVVVDARRVIVAVPPVLAKAIDFSPRLPRGKAAALRQARPGVLLKWEAVYDRPFWRDAGLSGQANSVVGPANATFDNSPPNGSPGIVFGFVGGKPGRANLHTRTSSHRAQLVSQLIKFFGPQASHPRAYFEGNWTREAWTRGCPVGHFAAHHFRVAAPHLRQAVGPVHFAGTETSTYWNGYMDGAIRSGERAAAEVLGALR